MLLPGALDVDLARMLDDFVARGYARVGPALAPAAAARLGARAHELMLGSVPNGAFFFQHDAETGRYDDLRYGKGWEGPSLAYRKIEKLERDELYRAWIENPLFERIARALIPGGVVLYRAVLFTKAARGGSPLPFHQDGGLFWGVDRPPILQIWTALDDASAESGCLEVVPGSHRTGLATPHGGIVPPALVEAHDAERRVIALPARAGEVILVHNHVWHRSGVNHTDQPRRALSVCYMSDATRCLRRKRAPREFVRLFAGARPPGG